MLWGISTGGLFLLMSRLYVKVRTGFFSHRKTAHLWSLIGNDAYWLPIRLWAYCAENQPDGDLSKFTDDALGMLLGCDKHASSMLQALVESGFMTRERKVCNWDKHNSYHVTFSERATKAAKARWAAKAKKEKNQKKEDPDTDKESERDNEQAWAKHASSIGRSPDPPPQTYPEQPSWDLVQAYAQSIGLAEWRAKDWFDEMEGCGWQDKSKRPIVKWQSVLVRIRTYWEADGRPMSPRPRNNGQLAAAANGVGTAGGVSGNTAAILASKELERVEAEMQRIRSQYDSHQTMDDIDRDQIKSLKERRKELKTKLGFKV